MKSPMFPPVCIIYLSGQLSDLTWPLPLLHLCQGTQFFIHFAAGAPGTCDLQPDDPRQNFNGCLDLGWWPQTGMVHYRLDHWLDHLVDGWFKWCPFFIKVGHRTKPGNHGGLPNPKNTPSPFRATFWPEIWDVNSLEYETKHPKRPCQ